MQCLPKFDLQISTKPGPPDFLVLVVQLFSLLRSIISFLGCGEGYFWFKLKRNEVQQKKIFAEK